MQRSSASSNSKPSVNAILGESFNIVPGAAPQGVQTDLFGNAIDAPAAKGRSKKDEEPTDEDRSPSTEALHAGKNIHNTAHQYRAITEEAAIDTLIKELMEQSEICFDTETTNLDANDAELVGMSFSYKTAEAYFVPCSPDQEQTKKLLQKFVAAV